MKRKLQPKAAETEPLGFRCIFKGGKEICGSATASNFAAEAISETSRSHKPSVNLHDVPLPEDHLSSSLLEGGKKGTLKIETRAQLDGNLV